MLSRIRPASSPSPVTPHFLPPASFPTHSSSPNSFEVEAFCCWANSREQGSSLPCLRIHSPKPVLGAWQALRKRWQSTVIWGLNPGSGEESANARAPLVGGLWGTAKHSRLLSAASCVLQWLRHHSGGGALLASLGIILPRGESLLTWSPRLGRAALSQS